MSEAKEFISVSEIQRWVEFQEEFGTISLIKKLDTGFALLAHLICLGNKISFNGKVPSLNDFMYKKPSQPEVCTDINQAFKFLKSIKKDGD